MPKNIKDIDGLAILSGDGLLPVILAKFAKRKKIKIIVVSFEESNKKLDEFNPIYCDISKPLVLINLLCVRWPENMPIANELDVSTSTLQ